MDSYGYIALVLLLTMQGCLATTPELENIKDTIQNTLNETLASSTTALNSPIASSLLTTGLQTVINAFGLLMMSALVAFGLYSAISWGKNVHNQFPAHTGYAPATAYDHTGQAYTKDGYPAAEQAYVQEQTHNVHQAIEQAAKKWR